MEIILGLDISTQCIGLTLAKNDDGKINIFQVTHFKLKVPSKIKGIESLFHKSRYFSSVLETYRDLARFNLSVPITKVIIEEPLIGSNNSETVSTLLRFNGMISQSVYAILNVIPEFISSYDARKFAFPELMAVRKYNKKGEVYPLQKIRRSLKKNELTLFGGYDWDADKKLILWNKLSDMFPDIQWLYDKKNELKKENFDASDSLVCVIGYVRKKMYEDYPKPSIVDYVEEKTANGTVFKYRTKFGSMIFSKVIEVLDDIKTGS